MAGWLISLIGLIVLFFVVGKQQRKGNNLPLIHQLLACVLCVYVNGILSFILYQPVMDFLGIRTDGFMNMNGLVTAAVIWMILAIIGLLLSAHAKKRLGFLYRIIRITYKVCLLLPVTVLVVLLFVASFK